MSSPSATTSSTTESVRGVWQRQFEEDPVGDEANADRDTLVFWTQAPKSGIYIDIRLPKGSPGRTDHATATTTSTTTSAIPKYPAALQARGSSTSNTNELHSILSETEQSILLRQKSFCGRLQFSLGDTTESGDALAKDPVLANLAANAAAAAAAAAASNDNHVNGALPLCTCFWKREIDYQPPSGGLDIGVCASAPPNPADDGSIDLRETGDDGSYAEGWHRLVGSTTSPFWACQLLTEDGIPRTGYWVRTGKYFAYAIGRPQDAATAETLGCPPKSAQIQTCVGKSLEEAVQELVVLAEGNNHRMEECLAMVGTYVCVFGEVITTSTPSMTACWKILHSTDPRLVGCDLLGPGPDSCSTLSRETPSGGLVLQEGDIVSQTLVSGGCTRRWQVMEVDNAAIMEKDLPGLV
jgi:hypothetical protein